MKNHGRPPRAAGRTSLLKLLSAEFRDARLPAALFEEFLGRTSFDEEFCLRLMALARQADGVAWEARRLAVLMLEHQILKLPPERLDTFGRLLAQLGLKPAPGPRGRVSASVLREGYTTTGLAGFVREFRRRLARLDRVHRQIKGGATEPEALRDFVEVARRDCKLTLARYLFTPEEVVAQILRHVQSTDAVRDIDVSQAKLVTAEAERALRLLPDFEAAILRGLCDGPRTFWVSDATGSDLNSLVEYPLTTVVLVVKPPGSDVEFEIKRAGLRGRHSLGVVYARRGYTVPPSHRLDGGSMQWLLRYEADAASRLSAVYRLAHEEESPVARYVARANVYAVPAGRAEVPTLTYFTDPQAYGGGFRRMREAMADTVAAFRSEGELHMPELPGELGLSASFIGSVTPAQAILTGTTSFRLDKLAAYLSRGGPGLYFTDGLGVSFTRHDARRFADALLEEVLGTYRPPAVAYRGHEQYVRAALAVPENRERADRVYLSLVRQIGKCWGTLLAARGHSRGESFVSRNVGLKSFWDGGRWQVRVVFMDHDALAMASPGDRNFYAQGGVPMMNLDETYIWGESCREQYAESEVGRLRAIYRISERVVARGRAEGHAALRDAYRKTLGRMERNPKLRRLFDRHFIRRLRDWDALVGGYLRLNGDASANARWEKAMRRRLKAKGYGPAVFDAYLKTIERNRAFLEKYAFLFDGAGAARRGEGGRT